MTNYIERGVAMEVIANVSFYLNPLCLKEQRKKIKAIPTADVTEVKHGKWKINSDGYYPYCSECNNEPKNGKLTKYCPECGAKMDKE